MKKIFCPLLATLLTFLIADAVNKRDVHPIKKIEANPINVAVMLSERPDSTSIASTCEYYGYILESAQDGYTVYKHPKGSIIRFSFERADNGKEYSTIEVTSKVSQKEKDHILQELNFQKSGNAYERLSVGYMTRCTNGSRGSIIFQQRPKYKTI